MGAKGFKQGYGDGTDGLPPPNKCTKCTQTCKTHVNIGPGAFRKRTQSVPNPYQVYPPGQTRDLVPTANTGGTPPAVYTPKTSVPPSQGNVYRGPMHFLSVPSLSPLGDLEVGGTKSFVFLGD